MKQYENYFTAFEKALWLSSVGITVVFFMLFDRSDWVRLSASLVGVTSLLFCAKGHPVGQALMIVFSLLYGVISFSFAYYGEMITYLGMTMPMAVLALTAWLRHPYAGNKREVAVNPIPSREWVLLGVLTAVVTIVFYFILQAFHTANLLPSTLSVTTSFAAAYLTFRRSPYYALAYALNDLVLMVLWVLAATADIRYLSVIACFAAFFANDIYGFISWQRMKNRQIIDKPR